MSIQSIVQKQNMRRSQVADSVADYSVVTGIVELSGTGQGYAEINFPVVFTEKPTVSFGYELGGSRSVFVPSCSAVVNAWTGKELKSGGFRYSGCTVGVVVAAEISTLSYLHFTFAGIAFRNPVSPSMDVKETI